MSSTCRPPAHPPTRYYSLPNTRLPALMMAHHDAAQGKQSQYAHAHWSLAPPPPEAAEEAAAAAEVDGEEVDADDGEDGKPGAAWLKASPSLAHGEMDATYMEAFIRDFERRDDSVPQVRASRALATACLTAWLTD